MIITLNSIYYFFSTSAQAYAALLAILLTLILFRIQRLIDQRKEEVRKILEDTVENTIENRDIMALRRSINLEAYWLQKDDTGRFNLLKKNVFNFEGNLIDQAAGRSGESYFPPQANTDFLRTLWIRAFSADAIYAMATISRRTAMNTFILGNILIMAAILLTILPSAISTNGNDSSTTLSGFGSLLLIHFVGGLFFLRGCYKSFKSATDIKI